MGLGPRLSNTVTHTHDGELRLFDTRMGLWDAEIVLVVHREFKEVIGDVADRIVVDHLKSEYESFFNELVDTDAQLGAAELEELFGLIAETGYGTVESVDAIDQETFTVQNSVESYYYREQVDEAIEDPTCFLLQAKLEAALSVATGTDVTVTETACRSLGDSKCVFRRETT